MGRSCAASQHHMSTALAASAHLCFPGASRCSMHVWHEHVELHSYRCHIAWVLIQGDCRPPPN